MSDRLLLFIFGVAFLTVLTYAGLRRRPFISGPQFFFLRIVAALAGAGVAASLPGTLSVEIVGFAGVLVKAGGALSVFVLIYLVNPPAILRSKDVAYQRRGDDRKDLNMPVIEALIQGDYKAAERRAREYLSEYPDSVRAAYNLAVALVGQTKQIEADTSDKRMMEARDRLQSVLHRELFLLLRDREAVADPVGFVLNDPGLEYLFRHFPGLQVSIEAYSTEFKGDMGTKSYGSACFGGSMEVVMSDGVSKPIRAVQVGETVLSAGDGAQTATSCVVDVSVSMSIPLIVNGSLVVSSSQPLRTLAGEWVQAGGLKVGDEIEGLSGAYVRVRAVGIARDIMSLYTLNVAPHHTYYVAGLLVHNKLKTV